MEKLGQGTLQTSTIIFNPQTFSKKYVSLEQRFHHSKVDIAMRNLFIKVPAKAVARLLNFVFLALEM